MLALRVGRRASEAQSIVVGGDRLGDVADQSFDRTNLTEGATLRSAVARRAGELECPIEDGERLMRLRAQDEYLGDDGNCVGFQRLVADVSTDSLRTSREILSHS